MKINSNHPMATPPHFHAGDGARGATEQPMAMAGAEPGMDSAGAQTRRTAKTCRRQAQRAGLAKNEQKETGTGTRGATRDKQEPMYSLL